jgi:hypothetical protein
MIAGSAVSFSRRASMATVAEMANVGKSTQNHGR